MSKLRCVLAVLAVLAFGRGAASQGPDVGRSSGVITHEETPRAQIASLKAALDQCGDCYLRPLLQARLNQMLKMGKEIDDTLGHTEPTVASPGSIRPPAADDFAGQRQVLAAAVAQEAPQKNVFEAPDEKNVYDVSENQAKLAILDHCVAMYDLTTLSPLMTPDEIAALSSPAAQAEVKAKILQCIRQYDPQQIIASRQAALEYCLKAHNYFRNSTFLPAYCDCMNSNDMLLAMCNQELRLRAAYMYRDNPGGPPPAACPCVRANPKAVRRPGNGAAPGLPPSLLTVVTVPPRAAGPPVAIPNGTVLTVTVGDAIYVDAIKINHQFRVALDQPIQAGGKEILRKGLSIDLKVRILGPGPQPDTVRLALATDHYARGDGSPAPIPSDELVQTIKTSNHATVPGMDFRVAPGTKLDFTVHN